jgi:hypothetical protein
MTFFFVSASIVGAKFEFTKLKNHRRPIQRTPATTCPHRNIDSKKFMPSMMSSLD